MTQLNEVKIDAFNNKRISDYDMDYSGMQIGADHQLDLTQTGRVFIGIAEGYGQGKVDYLVGDGKTESYQFGAYLTYQSDNDFYIDGILKYTHMKNKINTYTANSYAIDGKGNTNGISLGVEVGKRFTSRQKKKVFI